MLSNMTAVGTAQGESPLLTACNFQVSSNTLSTCPAMLAGESRLGSPALANRMIHFEALFTNLLAEWSKYRADTVTRGL